MKKIYILILTLPLLLGSCSKFLDVNTDPNNPTEVTPDLLLPVAQVYTASYYQSSRGVNHLGNMFMYNWSESFGFSWYDEEFQYLVTPTFYDALFDNAYSNALKQYADLDNLGDEYVYYKSIGKIMKAYHFQILVDLYGDIPYSEALGRGENASPKYDDAKSIYSDLLVQLDDAISMIKNAGEEAVRVENDVMFDGEMTEWLKFANTLKVRILTRGSNSLNVADELAKIDAEGSGFITSDVMINPGYTETVGKRNPFWEAFGWDIEGNVLMNNDATCATDYVIAYLQATNDTRIDYIYEEPEDGHKGVAQSHTIDKDDSAPKVSNIGPGILQSADMGAVIFSLSENYFNLSELALSNPSIGNPEALYESAIEASFVYLGLDVADAQSYYGQGINNVNYAASTNKLEAIITQKWVALNGISAEQTWFDYSRTGFPSNLPISPIAPHDDRPVRLAYPSSEITSNGGNLPKQPDVFKTKIFWAN